MFHLNIILTTGFALTERGERMSRYGRGDFDDMAYELDEFLEDHTVAELLRLVTDAVDWYEEKIIRIKMDGDAE